METQNKTEMENAESTCPPQQKIENAENTEAPANVVVKKPEETCCGACYKQCTRDSIYQTLPGETWQQKDFRIRSVPDEYIEWNNDPPCPRGLLVCDYCNDLADCKQKRAFYGTKCVPMCGVCVDEYGWRGWGEEEAGGKDEEEEE